MISQLVEETLLLHILLVQVVMADKLSTMNELDDYYQFIYVV